MINLHSHTKFSDGLHSPEVLVKAAVRQGLKIFGISDHYFTKKCPEQSLTPAQCEIYIQHLQELREKVKDKVILKIGLEIDFSLFRTDFSSFPWELTEKLDYVLLEYVEEKNFQGLSLQEARQMRSFFKCAVGLAHNDIEQNFTPARYDELLHTLEEYEIFMELCPTLRNSRGVTPYYYFSEDFFRQAKNRRILFSIGTDTHIHPQEVGEVSNAFDFLTQLGLEDQIIFLSYEPASLNSC